MALVLLSALASTGAAAHCVGIARSLRDAGHDVVAVTAEAGAEPFRRAGFEVHLVAEPPPVELAVTPPPPAQRAWQLYSRVQRNLIGPLPGQWEVVSRLLRERAVDVVVTDPLFLGASMLAALPRAVRPAVIMLGLAPPWLPDPMTYPYGMGLAPTETANRFRVLLNRALSARAFALLSQTFNREVERVIGVRVKGDLRFAPRHADAWVQLSVPYCEYPRSALPANFRFIGPLRGTGEGTLPEWWDPVLEPAVIVVRDDADADPRNLVLPTVRAFGDGGSTVVVVGMERGWVESAYPADLPANVHFEPQVPWSRLNPRRTIVIANGDYLHAQQALRQGMAMVLGGTLEMHLETAARVAWLGAGVNLRVNRATPEMLRDAVLQIRGDDRYRSNAAKAAVRMQAADADGELCALVDELSARVRQTA